MLGCDDLALPLLSNGSMNDTATIKHNYLRQRSRSHSSPLTSVPPQTALYCEIWQPTYWNMWNEICSVTVMRDKKEKRASLQRFGVQRMLIQRTRSKGPERIRRPWGYLMVSYDHRSALLAAANVLFL